MNKAVTAFVIQHLDKALWNLECANKLAPGSIPEEMLSHIRKEISKNRKDFHKEVTPHERNNERDTRDSRVPQET